MSRLIFNADEVRRIVEHSINAPEQRKQLVDFDDNGRGLYADVAVPSVILVHDDGVYLMSNGTPRDIEDPAEGVRSFCAYAKDCNPHKDADWWDRSRELVGGDDFSEVLPFAVPLTGQIQRGAKQIVINFGKSRISLGTPKF